MNYIHPSLKKFNEVFCKYVVEQCQDTNVLLTLSGGLDTRAIMSVLHKHNIIFDAVSHNAGDKQDRDVPLAKAIAMYSKIHDKGLQKHHIYNVESVEEAAQRFDELFNSYDVVFHGNCMSGVFDMYDRIEMSEHELTAFVKRVMTDMIKQTRWSNVYFPAAQPEIQEALCDVPIMFRYCGYPQRTIIYLNDKKLLSFPLTYFNRKKWLMRKVHWTCMDLILGVVHNG
jgi:hypothetical protein